MCGIVGVAGNLNHKDEVLTRRLLMLDFFRGPDSTGLAAIRDTGDVHIAKLASDPVTLFGMKGFSDALNGPKSRCFIGHNRFATHGAKTHFNAHPFEYGHIIGAHNGTLDLASWHRLEEAVGEKFGVDSQALIAAIAKLGIKDAIGLCTSGDATSGAWSLVWYDLFEGTINFLRNEHRPMWLAYNKDGIKNGYDRIFWASQWPMIDAAIRLSEFSYDPYTDEKGFGFFPTEVDVHYKFDVGLFITGEDKAIKPKVKTVKGREPPKAAKAPDVDDPFGRPNMNTFGFSYSNGNSTNTGGNSKKSNSRGTTRPSTPDNVINWLGSPSQPLAGYIDREGFAKMMVPSGGAGCQWCDKPLVIEEPGMIVYERDSLLLCGDCSGESKCEIPLTKIIVPAENFQPLLEL